MLTQHYPRQSEATILVDPTLLPGPFRPAFYHEMRNRMPHTNPSFVRLACLALMAGALGCGSDLVLPDSPSAPESISLSAAQGSDQQGQVGEVLGGLLVVKVVNGSQQPVSGMEVSFELSDAAGGSVDPTTATTNSQGEAYTRWTLGTVPGSYTATARLVQAEGDTGIAEFHAAVIAGAPDTVSASTPTAQPGQRNQPVRTPPQVRVVDRFGNPVPNTVISWQVTAGGGHVSSGNSVTDDLGLATIEWVLGDERGYQKLTASVDGITGSPVTFTAFVLF